MNPLARSGISRREFLARTGMGMGFLSLGALAQAAVGFPTGCAPRSALPRQSEARHSLLPERRAVARRHVRSETGARQIRRPSRCRRVPDDRTQNRRGFPSPFKFKKYGQSGIEVSELFAKTAEHIDDIAVIRSMDADVPNHEPSLMLMNCGDARADPAERWARG